MNVVYMNLQVINFKIVNNVMKLVIVVLMHYKIIVQNVMYKIIQYI